MTTLSIIVPTYNERDNVEPLVREIYEHMETVDVDYRIVFVDDDSPDETWKVAEAVSADYPVDVIRRRDERGLSSAVVRGLMETDSDYVIVMDADFSASPLFPSRFDPRVTRRHRRRYCQPIFAGQ